MLKSLHLNKFLEHILMHHSSQIILIAVEKYRNPIIVIFIKILNYFVVKLKTFLILTSKASTVATKILISYNYFRIAAIE